MLVTMPFNTLMQNKYCFNIPILIGESPNWEDIVLALS